MTRLLAVTLSLLWQASLFAQENRLPEEQEERNWYRVEIIVFSYGSALAQESEKWPLLPPLAYPARLQRLSKDSLETDGETPWKLITIEDSIPRADLELDRKTSSMQRDPDEAPLQQAASAVAGAPAEVTARQLPLIPAATEVPDHYLVLRPFTLLDDSALELNSRRLQRNQGRRILFHAGWYQPLRSREDTEPLLIEGSRRKGDYPDLQGTIRLYVSRYLHLETDLWLNTPGDYLPADWKMPNPPLAPEALHTDQHFFRVQLPTDWHYRPFAGGYSYGVQQKPEPEYGWRHAVTLKQKRRMRSGELHYIDHPLLGLLIKVTPYEFQPFFEVEEQVSRR